MNNQAQSNPSSSCKGGNEGSGSTNNGGGTTNGGGSSGSNGGSGAGSGSDGGSIGSGGDDCPTCGPGPVGSGSDGGSGGGSDGGGSDGGGIPIIIPTLHATDPNEILGPFGITTKKWMAAKDKFGFTVRFENDPQFANGPAQKVLVSVPIDPKFDINSLRMGNFGFGNMFFTVPANSPTYYHRLDVRDSLGVYVDVLAGIDVTGHQALWVFESIDPATGAEPINAALGFLPVRDTSINRFNDSIPNKGEGFVTFTIQPAANAQTGDSVNAQGSILFDLNAPVLTNVTGNTIDAAPPKSIMNASPVVTNKRVKLSWTGKDDKNGSGIKEYALYYKENGGSAILFQQHISDTAIQFEGTPGRTYSFYTLATDSTGNIEANKTTGDISITIPGTGVLISVKALMQGPFNTATGLMTDSLRAKALLPATDPYPALGFTVVNNTITAQINTGAFDSLGNKAVTDWVWLELRSSANPAQIVATRSALIRRDGSVVDMDGSSPVYFNNIMEGTYYVALRHRNHLGVMTGSALSLNNTSTTSIDFTSPATSTYGTDAQNNQNGTMIMWAGDANGDKRLRYNGQANDKNAVLLKVGLNTSNNILTIYDRADVNLDGRVRYNGISNDKNAILSVLGLSTPNKVITEQIPN